MGTWQTSSQAGKKLVPLNQYFFQQASFLVPASIVPGRMALLVTLFLMMVNLSTSATAHSPKSDQVNGLQVWLLTCIMFVFMALLEYATILYIKNMRGVNSIGFFFRVEIKIRIFWQVKDRVFKAGVMVVTPSKSPDSCWESQQTELQEHRIKLIDFVCIVLFPVMFLAFNIGYWALQYAKLYTETSKLLVDSD